VAGWAHAAEQRQVNPLFNSSHPAVHCQTLNNEKPNELLILKESSWVLNRVNSSYFVLVFAITAAFAGHIQLFSSGEWINAPGPPQNIYEVSLAACTSHVI